MAVLKAGMRRRTPAHNNNLPLQESMTETGPQRRAADEVGAHMEELIDAARAKTGTCTNERMRSYLNYELASIDDEVTHLKDRLRTILDSDHLTNAKRARELRKENFVFIRYLMIKELLNGTGNQGTNNRGMERATGE